MSSQKSIIFSRELKLNSFALNPVFIDISPIERPIIDSHIPCIHNANKILIDETTISKADYPLAVVKTEQDEGKNMVTAIEIIDPRQHMSSLPVGRI